MKRLIRIIVSYARCNIYLLVRGMWKGEVELTARGHDGSTTLIAASRGCISKGTIEVTKVFYPHDDFTDEEMRELTALIRKLIGLPTGH